MRALLALLALLAGAPSTPARGSPPACAGRVSPDTFVALRGGRAPVHGMTPGADRTASGIAVLADRGDLVVRRNPLDLAHRGIRLVPNEAGGFDAWPVALALEPAAEEMPVTDTEPAALDLPFDFPFFGGRWTSAHVHADGHLTFGAADRAPGTSLPRLLEGPPRIAAFYADLDVGRGGRVSARVERERVAVVWSGVAAAGQQNPSSFAAILHPSGTVDLVYGEMLVREGWAGVTPGGGAPVRAADLSAGEAGASGALLERFSETDRVDLVAVTARFAGAHPDAFDQIAVYTTRPLNPLGGTFAFEVTLHNATAGIGVDALDDREAWGGSSVQSVVFMDAVAPYRDVDGFEVLGHEIGHRWLAGLRLPGEDPEALLSADGVHWSFFLDTDASVLGGNDILPIGAGRFETVDMARRYGPLDQYAMGLRSAEEVTSFFRVEEADDFRPARDYGRSSSPEVGVSFTGVERRAAAADVVAAMGPRSGPPDEVPRDWRLAFVLVADEDPGVTAEAVSVLSRIRSRFEVWFTLATDGRGRVTTAVP